MPTTAKPTTETSPPKASEAKPPGSEVEVIDKGDLVSQRAADVALIADDTMVREYLENFSTVSEQTAEEIGFEIVKKVLEAQTVADVLKRQQVLSYGDLGFAPFTLRGVKFNRSGFDQREGVYAVLDVVRHDSGETVLVACGGRNVLAQAYRLMQLGAYPLDCRFATTPTAAGFTVVWLEAVPPRAESVAAS